MNPFVEGLLNVAGEVFQEVEQAAQPAPTQPAEAAQAAPQPVQVEPVPAEIAQGINAAGEIAAGDVAQGEQDLASLAAKGIAQAADPAELHNRLTQAEGWIATWHPVVEALAKQFGLEPPALPAQGN